MATVAAQHNETTFRSVFKFGKHAYRNARHFLQSMPYCLPRVVQCNVCHWRGRHFKSDLWHKHSVCPICRCSIRHRLLCAALEHIEKLSWNRIVRARRVLHFAPERQIERMLRASATSYFSADCHNRRDLKLDISEMSSVEDATFDLLIACDVLEHVEHDRRAIREIHRVLSPGGWAIITVPQQDNLAATFEDASIVDSSERERVFGQRDHLRIYGEDFSCTLESAGFRVKIVDEKDFPDELVKRHVLFPPELSLHPLATNFRKVYFARKDNAVK
jgi:hypothetical protein